MGCLFEIFLQIFVEGTLGLFMFVYLKLAHILVPDKVITEKAEQKIKNVITTISVLLVLVLFIGFLFLLPNNKIFNAIGKYMVFIPLVIIGLQIVLGIIVTIAKIVERRKK